MLRGYKNRQPNRSVRRSARTGALFPHCSGCLQNTDQSPDGVQQRSHSAVTDRTVARAEVVPLKGLNLQIAVPDFGRASCHFKFDDSAVVAFLARDTLEALLPGTSPNHDRY